MIRTYSVSVTVAGSAGSATGSGDTGRPVNGKVVGVYVDYTSQPATTDTTITDGQSQAILTLTNNNTDGWYYPRTQTDDTAGSAISAQYDFLYVDDYVTVAIAQGDAGSVAVTLLVDES